MGAITNLRQEKFAQLIFAGRLAGGEAYVQAGYIAKNENTARACASRLLTQASVAARVAELQAEVAKQAVAVEITDRNVRLRWLDKAAHRILNAIDGQSDSVLDMAMFRELRATQQQAAQELGQWNAVEQPQAPGAGGPVRGFRGTFEEMLVRLTRYTGEIEA